MTLIRVLFILIQFHLLYRSCLSVSVITAYDDASDLKIDPDWADEVDWSQHPCRRKCRNDGQPLTCRYIFRVEAYTTMSKACYNCPFNITDCFRPHCVPGDGFHRGILTVNRQLPGPPIEVCQGDRIVVDVMNMLHAESTTMHWHGQNQMKTPYMDGVPHITQCPIPPGSSFRYDFFASQGGTHFWHSHLGMQRGDGLFGPLIVRLPPKKDFYRDWYDVDNFTLLICDWTHESGMEMFVSHHHAAGDNKPPNILVNGLGRFTNLTRGNLSVPSPIEIFPVKQNYSYRFRIINAEFLNCPIEISIDNHTLYVISSDGRDIEAIDAESLVIYAGERFDIIVQADQKVNNYWIRFRGLMDCDERFTRAHQVAILRYEGAPEEEPKVVVEYEREPNEKLGVQVNALNEGTESNKSVSVPLFRSLTEDCPANTQKPDYKFFIAYDFYGIDHPSFHRKGLYGYNQVGSSVKLLTPQLNHISMKFPPFPLLSQREMIKPNEFCNHTTVTGCEKDFCECAHVLQVKLNSVVEIILVDEGFAYDANHPFHLHGFEFRVLAMKRIGKNVTLEEVKKLDKEGKIERNLKGAPLKDTVTVPDGGYTVIRFHAKNPGEKTVTLQTRLVYVTILFPRTIKHESDATVLPYGDKQRDSISGYWFFHCHIEFHAEIGMSLVFKVGEHKDMVPVPPNFPRCGNWSPPPLKSVKKVNNVQRDTPSPIMSVGRNEYDDMEDGLDDDHDMEHSPFRNVMKLLPEVFKIFGVSSSANTMSASILSVCLLIIISLTFMYS